MTVLPLTRTYRGRSTHVEVDPGSSGRADTSYLKVEDIRAISPSRLQHRMGQVDPLVLITAEVILRRLLTL